MEIRKEYVIYELNNIMGRKRSKALEKIEMKGFRSNSFDSEEEAIKALVEDEMYWEDFVIISAVYITNH